MPGFIFAASGLAAVLYGLSDASTDGWTSTTVLGFLAIGLILLAVFVAIELIIANRGGQPLLDLRLFANGPFRAGNIANVFVTFSLFGGIFLFPIYLQNLRGQSAFEAGVLLLPQALASMVSVIIGGRLVDRIGVRAVMIPGLIILAFATWELSYINLYSSFGWLQLMFILRGLALGCTIQPLTVASLAEVRPQQLAQASSINTVTRSVASSLGIAVLATLVQTQALVHFAHLAELVTPSSRLGQLLPAIEAFYVSQGAALGLARTAALQIIDGLVQAQAFDLAIQDTFRLTVVVVVLAVIATFFVGSRRKAARQEPALTPTEPGASEHADAARAEAMLAG